MLNRIDVGDCVRFRKSCGMQFHVKTESNRVIYVDDISDNGYLVLGIEAVPKFLFEGTRNELSLELCRVRLLELNSGMEGYVQCGLVLGFRASMERILQVLKRFPSTRKNSL